MPRFRTLFFAALTATSSLLAQEKLLSLEDSFGAVEKVNVNVLVSREALSQAIAVSQQQRANLLPRVSLDAQQRRTHALSVSNDVLVDPGVTNRFDGKLTGTYNLLSPTQIASYRAARRGAESAEADYRLTMQNILTSVAQTFFLHQRNIRRIAVLDANIERARALLDLARRQLAAGVATQIDVTRSEAQMAVAEQARLQQDTTVVQSEMQLKRLLDLDAGVALKIAPFTIRRASQELFGAGYDKAAFEHRPDYTRAQKTLQQNRENLRAAGLQRLGTLSVFGEYGYVSPRAFDGKEKEAWLGGAELNVPIFDAFRISADKRVALSQVRSQEYRLRSLELLISSELRLAAQDARSRFAQVEVAERSLRLAQDELSLAQRRYEQGVADNREVVEAQNRLAQADDNLVEAVYQYNLSRVELARAKGEVRDILSEKAN
ncbi:MAG: TolC family protein [Nibricoccus sp.]